MDPGAVKSGARPPQQARSRAALQRLLASAEHLVISGGPDDFTSARVAEHAGISVGRVYRPFASKEGLIDAVRQDFVARLENAVADALEITTPSLAGVVTELTTALGQTLAGSRRRGPPRALAPWWPDGLAWQQWACETADMATAYLTAEREDDCLAN